MEIINLLHFKDRSELRQWLADNHCKERCCWVVTYRNKCPKWSAIPYIEVVEEALCFGWIDSTLKRLPEAEVLPFQVAIEDDAPEELRLKRHLSTMLSRLIQS